ncbi:hypothetical protein ACF06W_18450 [Streptomyces albus]|uniref:hypothetical protein n=1 Tax=Streptomyces albus TaxID=1888 RepID=UPI0036F53337
MCQPCTRAAEFLAYVNTLAADSPLAAAVVDLTETVEQADAARATNGEAQHAAALVTAAEATDGTWRGQRIGDQPDDTLFALDSTEQGALFDERAAQ